MFDVGASELLVLVIVAIVVIGPKDLPMALRTAGRWVAKVRRVSNHFRSGIETMIREAEMEEMERKWREQNERIMAESAAAAAAQDAALQTPAGGEDQNDPVAAQIAAHLPAPPPTGEAFDPPAHVDVADEPPAQAAGAVRP